MSSYLTECCQWLTNFGMDVTKWFTYNNGLLTIIAIILAPIIALRVQTKLETVKEKKQKKLGIFKTLIATYATRVSPDHIQSLNMINIEFYGINSVIDSWRLYQEHLVTPDPKANDTSLLVEEREDAAEKWITKGNKLFIDLLVEISKEVGLPFDIPTLSKGVYYPLAQQKIEQDNMILREGLLKIVCNREPLSMDVKSFPVDTDAMSKQMKLQDSLIAYYDGKKSVKITLDKDVSD